MGILRTDVISHSQLSNGNASVLFDGTTDSLTIPSHSALAFGTGDWTVEGWFYFTDLVGDGNGQQTIVGDTYGATAGWYLYKQTNHRLGVYYSSLLVDGTATIEADRWYHLAFVRHSGITRIYIDGELDAEGADTTDATITQYYIGDTADQTSGEFFGYMSNLRITRTAVYKDNFTVPTFKLKEIPGTILLCCQSSSSTIKADVSVAGALTANGNPTATAFGPGLKEDNAKVGVDFNGVGNFATSTYMIPPSGTTRERYQQSTIQKEGGSIITGNLIMHLDAGDPISYAGVTTSNSTIYSLSNGGDNNVGIATLASGHSNFHRASWVNKNGGAFSLASHEITGNRIEFPYISLGNDNYTINIWARCDEHNDHADGVNMLISNKSGGPVSFGGDLKEVGHRLYISARAYYTSWHYRYAVTTHIGLHEWHMLTWVNTAQYTGSMYVDGVLQTLDDGNTTWNSRTSNNTPLDSTAYAGSETFTGLIGQIQLYNDTLSATEILQNYNAHKCRYDNK